MSQRKKAGYRYNIYLPVCSEVHRLVDFHTLLLKIDILIGTCMASTFTAAVILTAYSKLAKTLLNMLSPTYLH